MKRLTFLASLFGLPLLGQKRAEIDCTGGKCDQEINRSASATCTDCITLTAPTPDLEPEYWMQGRKIHWFSGSPLNNQCPVCGTMAASWKPKPNPDVVCATSILNAGTTQWGPCAPPTERRIDCERCNATFRQRAE